MVAVRRQLKRQMRGFPAAPCCVDPRFKLKALAPSAPAQPSMADLARGLVNLGNAGTLALSSTRCVPLDFGSPFSFTVDFVFVFYCVTLILQLYRNYTLMVGRRESSKMSAKMP